MRKLGIRKTKQFPLGHTARRGSNRESYSNPAPERVPGAIMNRVEKTGREETLASPLYPLGLEKQEPGKEAAELAAKREATGWCGGEGGCKHRGIVRTLKS